jgi:uncharacterized protein (DUF1778 family)
MAHTAKQTAKSKRLEFRAPADVKRAIERAAEIRGNSVTDFVINNMREVAVKVIEEHEAFTLREQDRAVFYSALLNPPSPSAYAKAAIERYRAQTKTNSESLVGTI